MGNFASRIYRTLGRAGYCVRQITGRSPRILVHLDWNLGDEIMAIPLFVKLREKYPRALLGVRSKHGDIFANNPNIDVINPDGVRVSDRVLNIRGEKKSQHRLDYWQKLLGVVVEDRQPRLYFSREERRNIDTTRCALEGTQRIAIAAWTAWKSKRWPQENFLRLANQLLSERKNIRFVEMGQDCSWLGMGENRIDQTTIREAAVLLASCDLFIGNDSGLMHLAAAAGIPAIGLFGPIDPCSLVGDNKFVYSIWSPVQCKGCWTQSRMLKPDQCPLGEPICMEAISPAAVCQLALRILDRNDGN